MFRIADDSFFINPGIVYVFSLPFFPSNTPACAVCIVSVFLWDAVLKFGSINHYMLPNDNNESSSFKYGDIAIPELLNRMQKMGSVKKDIRAKIFGDRKSVV